MNIANVIPFNYLFTLFRRGMERKGEEVYAVKFTNGNITTVLEIDPDAIAATADTFCYVGETKKVDIIGQRRYMVALFEIAVLFLLVKLLSFERKKHILNINFQLLSVIFSILNFSREYLCSIKCGTRQHFKDFVQYATYFI